MYFDNNELFCFRQKRQLYIAHLSTRCDHALFDNSSFGKLVVEGEGAAEALDWICRSLFWSVIQHILLDTVQMVIIWYIDQHHLNEYHRQQPSWPGCGENCVHPDVEPGGLATCHIVNIIIVGGIVNIIVVVITIAIAIITSVFVAIIILRTVYNLLLNQAGGIEADLTITRWEYFSVFSAWFLISTLAVACSTFCPPGWDFNLS